MGDYRAYRKTSHIPDTVNPDIVFFLGYMNALTDLVIAWAKSFAVVNAVEILGVDHC
jgi:hypothetical protein